MEATYLKCIFEIKKECFYFGRSKDINNATEY